MSPRFEEKNGSLDPFLKKVKKEKQNGIALSLTIKERNIKSVMVRFFFYYVIYLYIAYFIK